MTSSDALLAWSMTAVKVSGWFAATGPGVTESTVGPGPLPNWVLTAPGVGDGSAARQASGGELSARGSASSSDGPSPSGVPGQGGASA